MKTTVIVAAALAFGFLSSSTVNRTPEKVDVLTAVRNKWVDVQIVSNGNSSEDCIQMDIHNRSGRPLQLVVPAGVLMNTVNEDNQDILITRPENVLVDAGKTVTQAAYGFCCQAENGIPSEHDSFVLQTVPDKRLTALAEHVAKNSYDPGLVQAAIWAVSDGHSIGGIYNDNKEQCEQLRKFTADLLGQPVPFYNVDYGYELNTPFVYEPKTLQGNMAYELSAPGNATLCIYAPDGSLFHTFYQNRYMRKAMYTQNFQFTATDMMPGEYKVLLTIAGRTIHEQSILL